MDQLNLSDGEDLPEEILEKMKKMPVPDELLNFLGTFEQFDAFSSILMTGSVSKCDRKTLFELEKTKKMKWTMKIRRNNVYQRSMEPISIS